MSEWITDRPPGAELPQDQIVWARSREGSAYKHRVRTVNKSWHTDDLTNVVAWAPIDPDHPDKAPEWKPKDCPSSKHGDVESILEEAARITSGDRQASYGPPDQDFTRTAAMWTALFRHEFSSSDVALAMIALKLSRQTHQQKRDNWVDIAGYAHCGAICDEC